MSCEDLQRALDYVSHALLYRESVARIATEEPTSELKAEAARLDRLADREVEWAIGALKRDLGEENLLGD